MRLELGHHLEPEPLRTTEFAPAFPPAPPHTPPSAGYAPPQVGSVWKAGRFSGQDFELQPDGTLCCPAGQELIPLEHRREADGSLRVVYGASIRNCRPCPLRKPCQWNGATTAKPRQVSVLLHPLSVGSAPLRLSRLEPQSASARLYAARAAPTDRSEPVPFCRHSTRQRAYHLVSRRAKRIRASPGQSDSLGTGACRLRTR